MAMYYPSYKLQLKIQAVSAVFLSFISCLAFPDIALAGAFSKVAEEYHHNGYEAQLKGDYEQAVAFYYKALSVEPANATYYNDLALAYDHLGENDRAEYNYEQAIRLDPGYLPPYTNLGYLYKRKQNIAKAAYYFQQRIDLGNPNDPWTQKIREELEALYDSAPFFKEQFIKAQAQRMNLQVSESARRNFKNQMLIANAEYHRGLQLLKMHQSLDAIKAFNASLAFAPQNPKVLKARQEALREFRKEQVVLRAEHAMALMDQGQEQAAKAQFNEILTIIPSHSQ